MNLLGNVNKPINLYVAPLFWKSVHLYNWSVLTFSFSFFSLFPFNVYCNQHIFSKTVFFYFILSIVQLKLDIVLFPPFLFDINIIIIISFSLYFFFGSFDILEELYISLLSSEGTVLISCLESSVYKYFDLSLVQLTWISFSVAIPFWELAVSVLSVSRQAAFPTYGRILLYTFSIVSLMHHGSVPFTG